MHMPSLLEHRPGDAPHLYDLDTGSVVLGTDGKVARFTGSGRLTPLYPAALEAGRLLTLHLAWRRHGDGPDPANDAIAAGIDWLDANKLPIATTRLVLDDSLTSTAGRQAYTRLLAADPVAPEADAVAPVGARYARPYVEVFGTGHATDIEVCGLVLVPAFSEEAAQVPAPGVVIPEGFQWPEPTVPPIPITPTVAGGSAPGLYQPDPEVRIPQDWVAPFEVARTLFVSQGGDDSRPGLSLADPVRSIEQARDIAAADPSTLWSIQLWPGTYLTQGHIDMPDNVSEVVGMSGQRSVQIVPTPGFAMRNVFRGGSGFMLRNVSGQGWQVDDFSNPGEGFLVAFRPGALITRALYVDHCVSYRAGPPDLIPAPVDPANGNPAIARGPGIALADSAVVSPYSPFPQIMIEASTTSAPNGVGYVVKGDAFINALNTISIWPHIHFMALAGGEMLLNNCASQFGDYTLWAEGSVPVIRPARTTGPRVLDNAAAATIEASRGMIVAAMWSAVVAAGYGSVSQELSGRDAGLLVTALTYDLQQASQESLDLFLRGLFPRGQFVSPDTAPFVAGWQAMKSAVGSLAISPGARAMTDGLFDAAIATVLAPVLARKPSQIAATAHQFNYPFAGVNRRAFVRSPRDVRDTIVERAFGRVTFSGVDDRGKQYFTGGALVNPLTGKLEGPPVARTINPLARRAAFIAGGQS